MLITLATGRFRFCSSKFGSGAVLEMRSRGTLEAIQCLDCMYACECIFCPICIVRSAATALCLRGRNTLRFRGGFSSGHAEKNERICIFLSAGAVDFSLWKLCLEWFQPGKLWQYASRSAYNKQLPRRAVAAFIATSLPMNNILYLWRGTRICINQYIIPNFFDTMLHAAASQRDT